MLGKLRAIRWGKLKKLKSKKVKVRKQFLTFTFFSNFSFAVISLSTKHHKSVLPLIFNEAAELFCLRKILGSKLQMRSVRFFIDSSQNAEF